MVNLEFLKGKNAAFSLFGIKEGGFLCNSSQVLRQRTGIIYVIVNLVNGKVYVGQTLQTFAKRYKNRWWIYTDNDHLTKATVKYGHENFRILILEENRGQNILNILETYYILTFQSNNSKYGYNKTTGGDNNYILSQDVIDKMRYSKEEFINLAAQKHGDKYNYDLVEYKTGLTKVKIFCKACNDYFMQTPSAHLAGKGCLKCGFKSMARNNLIGFEEFQERAEKKFGNEYSFDKDSYMGFQNSVKGKHNKCGTEFTNRPNNLLKGSILCPVCYKEYHIQKAKQLRSHVDSKNISKWRLKRGFETYINKSKEIHGDKFTYLEYSSEPTGNGRNMLRVKHLCNDCKKEFWRTRFGLENGCPICNVTPSLLNTYAKSNS